MRFAPRSSRPSWSWSSMSSKQRPASIRVRCQDTGDVQALMIRLSHHPEGLRAALTHNHHLTLAAMSVCQELWIYGTPKGVAAADVEEFRRQMKSLDAKGVWAFGSGAAADPLADR